MRLRLQERTGLVKGKLGTGLYRVMCFWARAMAYSATTVFPADV